MNVSWALGGVDGSYKAVRIEGVLWKLHLFGP